MGIKNRNRRERRGTHQSSQIENQNVQLDQSTQSVAEESDHILQEILTDSTPRAKPLFVKLMDDLRSLEDTIIENDTKRNLQLMHLFIFDTISSMFIEYEECEKTEHANQCNEKDKEKEISEEQAKETNSSKDSKLPNVEKESDSKNQSKPIDISTERRSSNKERFEDTKSFADEQQKERSYFSVNRGITRNFGHKFTSFDKMYSSSSFPKSFASYRYKRSRRTDIFYYGENSGYSNNFPIRPWLKRNVTEEKKELSIRFIATNESKSSTFDKEKSEKHVDWRNMDWRNKTHMEWRIKKKTQKHYWRTVGYKGSKQHNLKCKDVGTQTDSILPTNNVEMVSVGTMWPEQKPYGSPIEDKDTIWELNYNHEQTLPRMPYQQLLSYSTSPSSTDLSFDAQAFTTPDIDDAAALLPTNLFSDTDNFKKPIRPPPGFPEVPQHSSLTSDIYNPEDVMLPSLTDNYEPNPHINSVTVIPPAPSPMRHLYYNYSEFMEPPTYYNCNL